MHQVVFLDRGTIARQIALRRPNFAHDYVEYERTSPEQVLDRLRSATIAIVNKVVLTAEILGRLPTLRLVAVAATGTDCIDKAFCREAGVTVMNIRDYAVRTVPEHVLALMLALRRSLIPFRQDVLDGEWQRAGQFCFFHHPIRDLGGARLGIVGKGALGQRVAAIGEALGMDVRFAGRKGERSPGPSHVSWEEFLATSDVISLHVPLTAETQGLIAMAEFRRMERRPLLLNTARGGLVNEEDLERALREGLVSGAGIDVTSPEPPTRDSPLMRIAALPNVIVTPHVAWASDEAMQGLADRLIDNIETFVAGEELDPATGGD
ncbi:D-2-hydroxyacid dehydrogenase [Lichenibacterium dinghuense]|uniref:D-2-hydroxyacid dehydrogenase n=1 Tax=Lichenibacterium dinghuense TaxID=2895977 RepID=UPI001F478288|nr:D-2-hydroxyacid dehydrogenase [Lichenibacterium sp. 6Y81]